VTTDIRTEEGGALKKTEEGERKVKIEKEKKIIEPVMLASGWLLGFPSHGHTWAP